MLNIILFKQKSKTIFKYFYSYANLRGTFYDTDVFIKIHAYLTFLQENQYYKLNEGRIIFWDL